MKRWAGAVAFQGWRRWNSGRTRAGAVELGEVDVGVAQVKQLWRGAHGKARGSKTGASAQKKVQKASKCAVEMNGTRV